MLLDRNFDYNFAKLQQRRTASGDALYKPAGTIQKTLDALPKPLDKAFTCAILQLNLLTMDTVRILHTLTTTVPHLHILLHFFRSHYTWLWRMPSGPSIDSYGNCERVSLWESYKL